MPRHVRFVQQYDDNDQPVPLNLPLGIKRHVMVYHDEMGLHANDQKEVVWLRDNEQPIRQRSKGQLTHTSDF